MLDEPSSHDDHDTPPPPRWPQPGERLGVWRVGTAWREVESGRWMTVAHSLTQQPAQALVYRLREDAEAVLMRFAEDSTRLAEFRDPAFRAALDSGLSAQGLPYLVVEPLDGRPLLPDALELPLKQRMALLAEFVALLARARAQGLVLRELDPGMLWLDERATLHWLGQGLSPADSRPGPGRVRAAQPYAGAARADTPGGEAHALGRLLCLLVNGRLPAGELPASAQQPGHPVRSLSAWLSLRAEERETLDALLRLALSGRFDGQALVRAVQDWIEGRFIPPPTLRPEESEPQPPAPSPARLSPRAPPAEARAWTPSRPPWPVVLAAACLVASLVWLAWRSWG